MKKRAKQCARCGREGEPGAVQCAACGTLFPRLRAPWRMTKGKIRLVHALARQKGLILECGGKLDDEIYRLRLQAVGVASCKALKRDQFNAFMEGANALPDVVGLARSSPPTKRRKTAVHSASKD